MRTLVALGALLLLGGCISSHHVEYNRVATTGVDSSGGMSHTNYASQDERHWQGPWPMQPERLRP